MNLCVLGRVERGHMSDSLTETLKSAGNKSQYNAHARKLLSSREVLSWILHLVVEECSEYSLEEIRESIGEKIQISEVPLNPGMSNSYAMPARIVGDNVVDDVPNEGVITFDIRFHMNLDAREENIKLLMNVEAQKKYDPGYDLTTRAIFYAARMISSQLETEFTNSAYDDIKKVYSIWVCMNAPNYVGNALSIYQLYKRDLIAGIVDNPNAYDKIAIVMITLNENLDSSDKQLHYLLNTLFSREKLLDEKKKVLKEEFQFSTVDEYGKEMDILCNLADLVEEQGIEKGEERLNKLISILIEEDRMEDLKRATASKEYREQLYTKYSI